MDTEEPVAAIKVQHEGAHIGPRQVIIAQPIEEEPVTKKEKLELGEVLARLDRLDQRVRALQHDVGATLEIVSYMSTPWWRRLWARIRSWLSR